MSISSTASGERQIHSGQELLDLTGRVAALPGGAGLLGFQMATALAEAGATIVIASRKLKNCQPQADEISLRFREAVALRLDANDCQSMVEMTDAGVQ